MDNRKNGLAKSPAAIVKAIREAAQALRDVDRDLKVFDSKHMRSFVVFDAERRAGLAVLAAMEAGRLPELESLHSWYRAELEAMNSWFRGDAGARIMGSPTQTLCPSNLLRKVVGDVQIETVGAATADDHPPLQEPIPSFGAWPGAEPTGAETLAAAFSIDPSDEEAESMRQSWRVLYRRRAAEVLDRIAEAIGSVRAKTTPENEERIAYLVDFVQRRFKKTGEPVEPSEIVEALAAFRYKTSRNHSYTIRKLAIDRGLIRNVGTPDEGRFVPVD